MREEEQVAGSCMNEKSTVEGGSGEEEDAVEIGSVEEAAAEHGSVGADAVAAAENESAVEGVVAGKFAAEEAGADEIVAQQAYLKEIAERRVLGD